MDVRHQRIRGQRDDAAGLCDAVRTRTGSRPQSSESEPILIVGVNIVWLFTRVRIDMPFVETQCRNNTAVASFPRRAKLRAGRQGLDASIEAATPGESPSHRNNFCPVVIHPNDRNGLRRSGVEIRCESPLDAREVEIALNGGCIGSDITPAHFQSLRRGKKTRAWPRRPRASSS